MKETSNGIGKGYTYTEKIDTRKPPRAETNEATQRPKSTDTKVSGDGGRGSFTSRQ